MYVFINVEQDYKGENIGWRLDYFVVSERMKDQITEAKLIVK